jgi:regulator of cell morphogenesis and NO signaling
MTITEQTHVADIAAAMPSSVRIFQEHGIDFCCGGKRPLRAVCDELGVSFGDVTAAIAATAATAGAERDWTSAPLDDLIAHIVATYHDSLRRELPRLGAMAVKVAQVHGTKAPHLDRVRAIVQQFADDMFDHMQKEESVLFPAIGAIARGEAPASGWLRMPITVMEHEHDAAGALLEELHRLTTDYTAPEWACQTFRALYHGLDELERATHVHVHLENNVLFPRALALAAA